jgi:hypothetical protein
MTERENCPTCGRFIRHDKHRCRGMVCHWHCCHCDVDVPLFRKIEAEKAVV